MVVVGFAGRESQHHQHQYDAKPHAAPDEARDATPEHGEQTELPVDDTDMLLVLDSRHDVLSDVFGFHHHRIMVVATKQCRIDKTRTDVGEVDVQSACDSLLLQSLEIDVLHSFRG